VEPSVSLSVCLSVHISSPKLNNFFQLYFVLTVYIQGCKVKLNFICRNPTDKIF
jgi:hypothetical protein